MNSVVIYASRSGNTHRVAERIAETLRAHGDVEVHEVDEAPADLTHADLILFGGPTEGHGVTQQMTDYLERLTQETIHNKPVAAFDTRLAWPRFLSGSAADGIASRLRASGARLVLTPESFIVSSKPELQPGELDRAGRWAEDVAKAAGQPSAVVAPR